MTCRGLASVLTNSSRHTILGSAAPSRNKNVSHRKSVVIVFTLSANSKLCPDAHKMAKILLVGDDPAEREVLGLVIEFGGHHCTVAVSLEEAVQLLKREAFNLVVTDVQLDRRSSKQIVKALKAASAEVAVMVLTGSGDTDVKEADTIVAFPCPPVKLLQRIEHALRKSSDTAAKKPSQREKGPSADPPWRRAAKA